jgi:RND family efflux transporter MFP subunit
VSPDFRLVVPVIAAVLVGCSEAEPPRPDPLVVTALVTEASASALPPALSGTIAADQEAALSFRVPGQLIERPVRRGERVRKGQVLARLDAADAALGADEAAAQARAADRQVAAAAALATRAAEDERRQRGLVESGSISALAFDAARAAADAASAELAAATARRDAARAAAARAANQRRYATLVADVDGVVTDLLVAPGEVVTAGQPVLRFAPAGGRDIVVTVPEMLRAGLPRQASARILATGQLLPARLREVTGAADPRLRSFEARYALVGGGGLAPGLTATLVLPRPAAAGSNLLQVPIGAVIDRGKGPGVWVIAGDRKVALRPVQLARIEDDRALLGAGVAAGERVVAVGAHLLAPGQRVRIGSLPQ